jgi:hypothetical protein
VEQERWESKQESSDDDNAETESEDNGWFSVRTHLQ